MEYASPSKEEFYESINEDTFAGAEFCRKLYGYCYTDDTFLEKVMDKFKSFGRDKVIYIYSTFVQVYLRFQMEKEKEAAKWLREQTDREYERRVKEAEWKKKQKPKQRNREQQWMEMLQILDFRSTKKGK